MKGRPASKAEKILLFFKQCVRATSFMDLARHCSEELGRTGW